MDNTRARLYPVFLNLTDECVVVIGGGPVAERKVSRLIPTGAEIKVISIHFTSKLQLWENEKKINLVPRAYRAGDLRGAKLAFAATNQSEINQAVAKEAKKESILLNVADQSSKGDFWVPACLFEEEVAVAVSAYGKDPKLAVKIRDHIRAFLRKSPEKKL